MPGDTVTYIFILLKYKDRDNQLKEEHQGSDYSLIQQTN